MNAMTRFFSQFLKPKHERRLHQRAVGYWERKAKGRDFVLLREFDPGAIEHEANHGFMLDLRAAPSLSSVAPVLLDEADMLNAEVGDLAAVPSGSLLARFAHHYAAAVKNRAPVTADYDFVTDAGYRVLCRGALLPLSSDGQSIDHVYGVISWKSEKIAS